MPKGKKQGLFFCSAVAGHVLKGQEVCSLVSRMGCSVAWGVHGPS